MEEDDGWTGQRANFPLTKGAFFFTLSVYAFCWLAYRNICIADVAQG
jgi:hypothetical protein